MAIRRRLRLFSIALPHQVSYIVSASGLRTVLQALLRYTFFGELFARLFREGTGFEPIEEFVHEPTASDASSVPHALATANTLPTKELHVPAGR